MIYCILGMSGAGKDTVVNELLKRNKNLKKIIPTTTRPPREGEKDGVDYYFTDIATLAKHKDEYIALKSYMVWNSETHWYGIHKDELKNGNIIATNLDTCNILISEGYNAKGLYLDVPFTELKRRLKIRNTNDEEIKRRLETDLEQYFYVSELCSIVKYMSLEKTVECISSVIENSDIFFK